MNLERPVAPDPYSLLPQVPSFEVTSEAFADGDTLPDAQVFDDWGMTGANISPQLAWSGAPAETKSYAVTCLDPDAPTGSGWWHWLVAAIPASVTHLDADAGAAGMANLPEGAFMLHNDYGIQAYGGACPPQGDRPHRYLFAVHALDTDDLGIDDSVSGAVLGFNLTGHTIARAVITATFAH